MVDSIEVDANLLISLLKEQRNQALDAAATFQACLIKTQEELRELKKQNPVPLEAVK